MQRAGTGTMGNENIEQSCWKVVQKTRRQRKIKENYGEFRRQNGSGTRFDVLADVDNLTNLNKENQHGVVPAVQAHSALANFVGTAKERKASKKKQQCHDNDSLMIVVPESAMKSVRPKEVGGKREKRPRDLFTNHKRNDDILLLTRGESTHENMEGMNRKGEEFVTATEKRTEEDGMDVADMPGNPIDPGDERELQTQHVGPPSSGPVGEEPNSSDLSMRSLVPETQTQVGL